ncbi:MAG: transposase, partial [Bradyrhizobium sp.]
MGARREVLSAVMERYRSAKRSEKGRILDELCATTGWHRKHAVRALRRRAKVVANAPRQRKRRYDATIKDAMTALWEASDRVCGKRLKVMIPTLLPA